MHLQVVINAIKRNLQKVRRLRMRDGVTGGNRGRVLFQVWRSGNSNNWHASQDTACFIEGSKFHCGPVKNMYLLAETLWCFLQLVCSLWFVMWYWMHLLWISPMKEKTLWALSKSKVRCLSIFKNTKFLYGKQIQILYLGWVPL